MPLLRVCTHPILRRGLGACTFSQYTKLGPPKHVTKISDLSRGQVKPHFFCSLGARLTCAHTAWRPCGVSSAYAPGLRPAIPQGAYAGCHGAGAGAQDEG
jgi:hypothetical protein